MRVALHICSFLNSCQEISWALPYLYHTGYHCFSHCHWHHEFPVNIWFVCTKHEEHFKQRTIWNKTSCRQRSTMSTELGLFVLWVPVWALACVLVGVIQEYGFPQIDVIEPLSEPLTVSTKEWSRTMPACTGTAAYASHCWKCHHPRRDRSWGWQFCGSFCGKKKSPYKSSPEASCHE